MSERRLNPDKLLQRAKDKEHQEKLGKLKIYLGAAPGVGKTHEMLHDALQERAKGLDVVIGVVESHGRKEVASMLKYFEELPKKAINYHGKELHEFDLDAALKRHPGLILMDEMAHSNAPDVRHQKRWQDIKELLERGIDVYTTLNVQHIESLNNSVSQIIHAPIKETVPDSMIEMADSLELVDIPPEELLKRLHEGKVYFPQQAAIAAEHFFRKGNLIALRELALRVMANRVNNEVLLYRQDEGIKYVWPTREKILVCVGPGPEALKLIRTAKRMASTLQAEWIAVYVDAQRISTSEEKRNQAIQNLHFAEQLGAETKVLTGFDVVKEIMSFAREQNVTQIMVWKYIRKRWRNLFTRNLADEIVRHSGEIDVYVVTGALTGATPKHNIFSATKNATPWYVYIASAAIVALATGINFLLFSYLGASDLIMVYLLGVTFVALLGEMGPSILASILSVLAYDFFFIPPYYSFTVDNIKYFFTLVVMLIVAQVISQLTLLTRRQALAARINENQISALYKLSREISSTRGMDKLLATGVNYIAATFDSEVVALIPQDDRLIIRASSSSRNQLIDEKELSVAQWVFELGQKAGLGTESLSFSKSLYLPLLGSQGMIGVLKINPIHPENLLLPEQFQLLEACANQIALALEMDRLQDETSNHEMK